MNLASAINLLSKRDFENQKVSVCEGLRALISTFYLFPLAKFKHGDIYC